MPVNTTHPLYDEKITQWKRIRHALEGSDAIKNAGELYLPKLADQSDDEYNAYKLRANWYGATARTVEGLSGVVMRKDPVVELPGKISDRANEITADGVDLAEFSKIVISELTSLGRYGILVDRSVDGAKAYLAGYIAETIINWKVNNKGQLERVVLEEIVHEQDEKDYFKIVEILQYRELFLDSGNYAVNIWRKNKKGSFEISSTLTPTNRSKRLDYIPFIFVSTKGTGIKIVRPPLLDLVDINISCYMQSADLEHGRHFTALPTPWVAGGMRQTKDNVDRQLRIGSTTAWLLDEGAQAGFLEFKGDGLGSLERGIESKKEEMAILGARLLQSPKKAAETAEKAKIDTNAEGSVLSSVATSASSGIRKALEMLAGWEGITGEIIFELNKDFLPFEISPQLLTALMQQVQANLISYDTYFAALQRGELIDPEKTPEDEQDLIEDQVLANVPRTGDDDIGGDVDESQDTGSAAA
jgi:hypothetical protein